MSLTVEKLLFYLHREYNGISRSKFRKHLKIVLRFIELVTTAAAILQATTNLHSLTYDVRQTEDFCIILRMLVLLFYILEKTSDLHIFDTFSHRGLFRLRIENTNVLIFGDCPSAPPHDSSLRPFVHNFHCTIIRNFFIWLNNNWYTHSRQPIEISYCCWVKSKICNIDNSRH